MKMLPLVAALLAAPLAYATPIEATPLQEIRAFQSVTPSLVTSGLPTPEAFTQLKVSGVEVVINLMPDSSNKSYNNEAELVTDAGMVYVAIPVDWQAPKVEDVDAFLNTMAKYQDKNVLVHCLANYRASAFVYLYEWVNRGEGSEPDKAEIMAPWGELEQSLKEYPQWAQLIEQVKANQQG
ncbi:protein tyrosine phosphatase family protein [Ferrimonas balearica]|uniref:protein tyrosine phosphatase family protein n=1 Tax=Ferrimonas balearica TaxID=44012 RepID=UPI001C99600F|nr:protein tyrosine phosphatase family protein [Ferrimonas balearica]MBY5923117.1 protein tyrosine phosphatase family protein [Ferrimonas balearica]MBY5997507.1 protein tyrosine phosphatase family protein [Ferrimonas balearica]